MHTPPAKLRNSEANVSTIQMRAILLGEPSLSSIINQNAGDQSFNVIAKRVNTLQSLPLSETTLLLLTYLISSVELREGKLTLMKCNSILFIGEIFAVSFGNI